MAKTVWKIKSKNKGILFLVICMLIGITACEKLDEVYTNTDELSDVIETLQPKIIELDNIKIKAQPYNGVCGITSVTVVSNYFNNTDYEANDLIKKYNVTSGGSSNDDMKKWLQREMPEKIFVHKSNGTNKEMISDIHASLYDNNPIVVSFGAPSPYNEPYYDFHSSVVFGINLDNETIIIANSYGYREEISFVDFLNRMSFAEIDKYPSVQQFSLIRNRMDKNDYFLIK